MSDSHALLTEHLNIRLSVMQRALVDRAAAATNRRPTDWARIALESAARETLAVPRRVERAGRRN